VTRIAGPYDSNWKNQRAKVCKWRECILVLHVL
jgi:hypothetical protein